MRTRFCALTIGQRLGLIFILGLYHTFTFANVPLSLLIENHRYEIELIENSALLNKIKMKPGLSPRANHYRGTVKGVPGSWLRVSQFQDRWQGVVSLGGVPYVIDHRTELPANQGTAQVRLADLEAVAANDFLPRACGLNDREFTALPAHTNEPASAFATAQEVAFSTLCDTVIEGTCLIAELEVAFDLNFQQRFSGTSEAADQAAALVNTMEGFYQNDFNISFEVLNLELLNNNVSGTTSANALLTAVDNAKDNGTFDFIDNPRALFHFVTGRDLDGGTAGIAFLDVLCSQSSVGLTSLITSFGGNPNIGLTGIVMAHEIGHNFGAVHDNDENSCANGFVMDATVTTAVNQFSSCSIQEIESGINSATSNVNPSQCFNFPVDVSLSAGAGNPTLVTEGEEFSAQFQVQTISSFESIPSLTITGSIPSGEGEFTSATINGQGCSVANQGLEYSCLLNNPGISNNLQTNAIGSAGTINITQNVSVTGSSDLRDQNLTNNQILTNINVDAGIVPDAPSGLSAQQGNGTDVQLSWQDNSNNESGFIIERRLLGDNFTTLQQTNLNVTSFTDTSSAANNTYEYRVSATNSVGDSDPSAIVQILVNQAPGATSGGGGGGGTIGWPLVLLYAIYCYLIALSRKKCS